MKPRVLLVEDDRWLAESYQRALEQLCDVDCVQEPQTAMDMIDQYRYDAVIADVMLERGLVIDLLHELQAYDDTAKLPVILCTSLAMQFTVDDMRAYGVVAVLDKVTMTPALMREAVHDLVDTMQVMNGTS